MRRLLFKQHIVFLIVSVCSFLHGLANEEAISLQHIGNKGGTHMGLPIWPADQPTVYYDTVESEIIIDGPGSEASYYDVDIVSMSTLDTMLSTQVNGTYDTIDVSSLPDDNYKIVITSSNFNEYEGYFTKVPGKNRWKWIYDDKQQ